MKYQDYLQLAKATECDYGAATINIAALEQYNGARLVHMALGLSTEAIELLDAVRAKLPLEQQQMELSDILWFSALACDELGIEIQEREIVGNTYPPRGIHKLAARCELFASRIKAAIAYGTPIKPNDPTPDFWRQIPKVIFLSACAIGDFSLGNPGKLMDLNIQKLRARYPKGKFDELAATVRNEAAETKAVLVQLELQLERPKVDHVLLPPQPTAVVVNAFESQPPDLAEVKPLEVISAAPVHPEVAAALAAAKPQ